MTNQTEKFEIPSLFFLFLSFFFLFNYFVLSMILTEPKEGQRKLLSVNSDATATSFSEAFHMAPANNPMDNMAASLRPKTGLQPMPPLTSTEKYQQNKKKLNLILFYFLKKNENLQIHSLFQSQSKHFTHRSNRKTSAVPEKNHHCYAVFSCAISEE